MNRAVLLASLAVVSASCVADLDIFVSNAVHCSTVSEETCTGTSDPNRRFCTACDEPYPWADFGIAKDTVIDVSVKLADGETNTVHFIPSSGAHPDITVVYGHGNFGGIEHYLNRVGLLYQAGFNLFVVDYRGYGKSSDEAEPSEAQMYDDAVHMRDALDHIEGVDPGQVFLYGFSTGTLPIIEMAVQRPSCGVFMEAPWPSAQKFANDSSHVALPGSFVATGTWDNIVKMPEVHVPLLVVHGSVDDFIVIEHARAVFDAANEPKQFVEVTGAGHGNHGEDVPTVLGDDAYLSLVEEFVAANPCELAADDG